MTILKNSNKDINKLQTPISDSSRPLDVIPGDEKLSTKNTEISDTIFKELVSDKKSVEKMKTPEFEDENHKIDFWLSDEEKKTLAVGETKNQVTKENRPFRINWKRINIDVLKKELAPGAYVREYQNDDAMLSYLVWQQLFSWAAVVALWLEDRRPTYEQCLEMWFAKWKNISKDASIEEIEEYEKILNKHRDTMTKHFKKWDNYIFPGTRYPTEKNFFSVGTRVDMHIKGQEAWTFVTFHKDYIHLNAIPLPEFGLALRLLKE